VKLLGSVQIEEVLLLLKIGFLVLLYLFIWRIVRTASRDLRVPQESFVLAPQRPRPSAARTKAGRLVVVSSPALRKGDERVLDSSPLTLGRSEQNSVALERDEYASARHARIEPRRDGVWIEDVGSTNGTFVNGDRVSAPRRLEPGDLIRIGETDLRFEPALGGER
jgi:predicted component of type VI protein secretion system